MTHENTELPPAGWHPDPAGSDQERFWDGTTWTAQLRSVPAQTREFSAAGEAIGGTAAGEEAAAADTGTHAADTGTPAAGADPRTAPVPPRAEQAATAQYLPQASFQPATALPSAALPNATYLPRGEAGFFRSLFDVSFAPDRVVTIKFARVLYILATVASILAWITGAIMLFIMSGLTDEGAFAVLGVLQLLFGWILPLLAIVGFRVGLEVMISVIRTSQHTAELVEQGQRADS